MTKSFQQIADENPGMPERMIFYWSYRQREKYFHEHVAHIMAYHVYIDYPECLR